MFLTIATAKHMLGKKAYYVHILRHFQKPDVIVFSG